MNLYKVLFCTICAIIFISLNSCSCSSSDDSENKKEKTREAEKTESETKPILRQPFAFDNWVLERCNIYMSNTPEKVEVIKKAFSIFEYRVLEYVQDNSEYSVDFLLDENLLKEYSDKIRVGYISLKSLEQILNLEIQKYNINNTQNPIRSVRIRYPLTVFSTDSIDKIKKEYERIDGMDLKKKERKRLYFKAISTEILKNYSVELDNQGFFLQFK